MILSGWPVGANLRQQGDKWSNFLFSRDFVNVLVSFPKPILAAVNGPAIGMGAAILPLCDIIYASDKASFFSPYGRLSQTPEGCSSLTFPHVMGMAMVSRHLHSTMTIFKLHCIERCFSEVARQTWDFTAYIKRQGSYANMQENISRLASKQTSKHIIQVWEWSQSEVSNHPTSVQEKSSKKKYNFFKYSYCKVWIFYQGKQG